MLAVRQKLLRMCGCSCTCKRTCTCTFTCTECCSHVVMLIHRVLCCSAVPAITARADGDEFAADLSPVPLAAQTHDGEY